MFVPGLVSITFRQLTAAQVVNLVCRAGLEAIEWGGDVHVPHGDLDCAQGVRRLTADAGLSVASYGSYYRAGHDEPVAFERILDTALALGAPVIRVWAGKQGSEQSDEAYRRAVIADSRRIARLADKEKIVVAYEYHARTLTDTCAGVLDLIEAVGEPNLRTYWQPPVDRPRELNIEDLVRLLPYLCHIHVFHWIGTQRRPLAEGAEDWQAYLQTAREANRDHGALIEFVADNDPENFLADAAVLSDLLKSQPGSIS